MMSSTRRGSFNANRFFLVKVDANSKSLTNRANLFAYETNCVLSMHLVCESPTVCFILFSRIAASN